MSILNRDVPLAVDGRHFKGIRELGFRGTAFVIDAYTTPPPEPRGTYFTCIPISSPEYRQEHPTRAAFSRARAGLLFVFNDWGQSTGIAAPADVLDALEAECVAANLPAIEGGP